MRVERKRKLQSSSPSSAEMSDTVTVHLNKYGLGVTFDLEPVLHWFDVLQRKTKARRDSESGIFVRRCPVCNADFSHSAAMPNLHKRRCLRCSTDIPLCRLHF